MVFSVQSVADLYLSLYGGALTILQPSGRVLVAKPKETCTMGSIESKKEIKCFK
jgi:hypothetical protein